MTEQKVRNVPRSTRSWVEPTTLEQLMRIQEEIIRAEQWQRKEPDMKSPGEILAHLRSREKSLLAEMERERPNG